MTDEPPRESLELVVQIATDSDAIPTEAQLVDWSRAALAGVRGPLELVVRIVDEAESAQLNETYRHKTGPTNVLSFPSDLPDTLDLPLLGDLVVCAPVVAREAAEQHKPLMDHWAHMVVHGVLHLRGFDHQADAEAAEMESMERDILAGLDIADPYAEDSILVTG